MNWILILLIGFFVFLMAGKLLAKKKKPLVFPKPARFVTQITCDCAEELRVWEKGDYIFKELEVCPKCKKRRVITGLWKAPDKEDEGFSSGKVPSYIGRNK